MRSKLKTLLALCLAVALCLSLAACGTSTPAEKDGASYVSGITLKYNGENIESSRLQLDLSSAENKFSAEVKKVGDVSDAVTYSSSDAAVAEVSDTGVLTLKSVGETVITAKAAAAPAIRADVAVSVVSSAEAEKHAVTVTGGTASPAEASAGTIVTIKAEKKEGRRFTRWQFENEGLWINGNTFRMPDADVTVSAQFETLAYTLNVENATFEVEGGNTGDKVLYGSTVTLKPELPEGQFLEGWASDDEDLKIEGNTFKMPAQDLNIAPEFGYNDYTITVKDGTASAQTAHFGDTVRLTLRDGVTPEGMIFAGWKGIEGENRVTYATEFTMPSRNVSAEPVFARAKKAGALNAAMDNGTGTSQITNKHTDVQIGEEDADCYAMPATYKNGQLVRIRGGNIFTGSADVPGVDQVAAVTFRNLGAYEITFEYYLENTIKVDGVDTKYTMATTGDLTIKPDETVTAYMFVKRDDLGGTPYPAIRFKEDIGGNDGEEIKLALYTYLGTASDAESKSYKLTVEGGSYALTGGFAGDPYAGDEVILTADEFDTENKYLAGWECSDPSVKIENNKFIMPANDVTVKAIVKDYVRSSVTVKGGTAQIAGGSAAAELTDVKENTSVVLTPEEKEGFRFAGWKCTVGGVEIVGNQFTMPAGNVVVEAVYEEITVENKIVVIGGTYKGSPEVGETITLQADEKSIPEGMIWVGWSGVPGVDGNLYAKNEFVMTDAPYATVQAVYAEAKYLNLSKDIDWGSAASQQKGYGKDTTIGEDKAVSYTIPKSKATGGVMLRFRGGDLLSSADSQQVAKIVLQNNSDKFDVTIEYVIEFGGEVKATTGEVTVRAGETITLYMHVPQFDDSETGAPWHAMKIKGSTMAADGDSVDLAIGAYAAYVA